MEKIMGKLVCEVRVGGEDVPKALTTAANMNIGQFVKTTPGIGKPFFWWPSIPAGVLAAVDFSNAPVVTSDVQANNDAVAAINVAPEDVLTFEA